ncbi:hypothetical protein C8R44DRAFT_731077 [Mycena epipterygia]|nr:hypothetical protein C8R44DRAFT_731077 [Mycena epipterygia]
MSDAGMPQVDTLEDEITVDLEKGKVQVPMDIWRVVVDEYVDIWRLPRSVIMEMALICHPTKEIFQPYLYRHVNLHNTDLALRFFATLSTMTHLRQHLVSLHFGFIPTDSLIWRAIRHYSPHFTQLKLLSFVYTNELEEPLGYILAQSALDTLPGSCRILQLRSDPSSESTTTDARPWESTSWHLHLASIPPPITTFIFLTPHHVVWPPSTIDLNSTLNAWTAQLRRPSGPTPHSSLRRMVLGTAFGDDARTQGYLLEVAEMDEKIYGFETVNPLLRDGLDEALMGMNTIEGMLGTKILWELDDEGEWETHTYVDMEYTGEDRELAGLFGYANGNCKRAWAHFKPYVRFSVAPHVDRITILGRRILMELERYQSQSGRKMPWLDKRPVNTAPGYKRRLTPGSQ